MPPRITSPSPFTRRRSPAIPMKPSRCCEVSRECGKLLTGHRGKIGEFYEWIADRLNDDAARAGVLVDLGLPPTIAVGQAFPQHQIKGINEYPKTISIETEVSAAHAQDSAGAGALVEQGGEAGGAGKESRQLRAYRDASDPSFDDFKKALGDIKEIFTTLTNFVKALDVEASTISRRRFTASSTS